MGKKRAFDFPETIIKQARLRQFGLCAGCGDSLVDVWEEAHHVIPNQSGNPANQDHGWLRTVENCVIVCDTCHDDVHGGNKRLGPVAPPEYYKHSHGQDLVLHAEWVRGLNVKAASLWGTKLNPAV